MANFLAVPPKSSSEVELQRPLQNFIKNTYSDSGEGDDFSQQVKEFSKQRTNAVCRKLDKHANSLDMLAKYYDQLEAIDGKLPIMEGQIAVNFGWQDAFDKGSFLGGARKQSAPTAAFEKVCVLFNIAAMNSQVAALQSMDDDDGLKSAAKQFVTAAGFFNHIKGSVYSAVQTVRTCDMQLECLTALSSLMLAQAQESFLRKARKDKMKDGIISKVALSASELYQEAAKALSQPQVKDIIPKDWIPTVLGKQYYMHAISEYHQALVCRASKSYGPEVGRLKHASDLLSEVERKGGQYIDTKDFAARVSQELKAVKKDNDFIYHDIVPSVDQLSRPGTAQIAKLVDFSTPLSTESNDLFASLVPLSVHNATVAYDNRKAEVVNREVGKLREGTQFMNSVLASLNLPASIEDLKGDSVPQSVLEKSQGIKQKGGLEHIDKLFHELPELLQRNREILEEAVRQLDEERETDVQMKEKFKEKWTRVPSDQLTTALRAESSKYRTILNNAVQADHTVKDKYKQSRPFIMILSKDQVEIAASLPSASGASALQGSPVVQELRQLMKDVDEIKTVREVLENEIKSATVDIKSKFMRALTADGAINEDTISNDSIDDMYSSLIQQVQESVRKQETVLNNVQDANTRFCSAKQTNAGGQQREEMLRNLATAYDSYMELTSNLQEGTKFYNDLTQILVKFQSKVVDLCFARKTEKEELLKDLTQSLAHQPPAAAPSAPTHHSSGVYGLQ
ncbi:programmed cell death 6-interacting protein isoform X2 [Strongylocentrotus purpuratus]|uniref:BRO1 domain-containing protein n=1 Tax=Strongylocentrotus purpuratus TaxID=7668 RepID=A0A7M7LST6_STRPU|nr:programmed cell death 6-interacting protein isoform X2 [Strongylocentrotus purpuratus]|eukprot:XP_011665500.1 PREDICTED: programmed cell death 6-interacting protein isoform X2 [Strongylocentrotus purpuratus]